MSPRRSSFHFGYLDVLDEEVLRSIAECNRAGWFAARSDIVWAKAQNTKNQRSRAVRRLLKSGDVREIEAQVPGRKASVKLLGVTSQGRKRLGKALGDFKVKQREEPSPMNQGVRVPDPARETG